MEEHVFDSTVTRRDLTCTKISKEYCPADVFKHKTIQIV